MAGARQHALSTCCARATYGCAFVSFLCGNFWLFRFAPLVVGARERCGAARLAGGHPQFPSHSTRMQAQTRLHLSSSVACGGGRRGDADRSGGFERGLRSTPKSTAVPFLSGLERKRGSSRGADIRSDRRRRRFGSCLFEGDQTGVHFAGFGLQAASAGT